MVAGLNGLGSVGSARRYFWGSLLDWGVAITPQCFSKKQRACHYPFVVFFEEPVLKERFSGE
jgi:hypothetical protein